MVGKKVEKNVLSETKLLLLWYTLTRFISRYARKGKGKCRPIDILKGG